MIAAASGNNVIGKDNDMIWRLPDDFKRFKALTSAHAIIMGRKTFESLPGILPNRTHVIVTRNKDYKVDGCEVESTLKDALLSRVDNDVFIIGGGEIYKQGIELADKIELTRVHANFEGDTHFPEINLTEWKLVNEEFHDSDLKHQYSFTYQTYIRI